MTAITPPPGRVRGVLLVVERQAVWYRRNWRATVVSSVLQPLLFLAAFGVGFGSLVAGRPGAADATGGVPYLQWLAPALLAVSAVQTATFESSYPVLSGFQWQRIYHAMTASPITPIQVAAGHVTWVATKIAVTGAVFVAVVALVGGARGPGILAALAAAVLTGAAMAAIVTAYAATVTTDAGFSIVFRLLVLPMTLFSGTFFPVDRLPAWVTPLVWVSPLWHGTELARGAALDRWRPGPALLHLAVLLALLAAGLGLAGRSFARRLGS